MTTPGDIVNRSLNAARLIRSTRQHLLEDQADAINASGDPENKGSGGISDPTPRLAALLAPFTAKERGIKTALAGVDKAFDHLELMCAKAISDKAPADIEPRCPGYSLDLRAQLGGCGKILESYRLANGKHQPRSTMLCVSCRKDKERDEREVA